MHDSYHVRAATVVSSYIIAPPFTYVSFLFVRRKDAKVIITAVHRRKTDNTTAKRKRTNNHLQNTTRKTKDRATRTPLKSGGELECSERVRERPFNLKGGLWFFSKKIF